MELRFVNREEDYLVFESVDGERFRVHLDDTLREAIRKSQVSTDVGVSPREVQMAIRSGESVASIASRLGVAEQVVAPFAAPIIDELRFVLQTALKTSLSAGDKMVAFEDLVMQTYPNTEFAIRKEGNDWVIEGGSSLRWHFDPKSRLIDPVSTAAKELSKSISATKSIVSATVKPSLEAVEPKPIEAPTASVHDLVQELRARRNPEDLKPASAKGRAALPSWDEIVLGTAGLDPDPDQRDS